MRCRCIRDAGEDAARAVPFGTDSEHADILTWTEIAAWGNREGQLDSKQWCQLSLAGPSTNAEEVKPGGGGLALIVDPYLPSPAGSSP